jgi:hypothetical protein
MQQDKKDAGGRTGAHLDELSIEKPRLTPQGRTDPDGKGRDSTKPGGGVKTGQKDKAEG